MSEATSEPLRLEWRTPEELADNPANWRRHPEAQTAGLAAVLEEVGWAGALLYNEVTGRLIDGHARKALPEAVRGERVPVLVGSWTEEQERTILATLDPLAAMAEADSEALASLVGSIETKDDRVAELLAAIAQEHATPPEPEPPAEFPVVDETIQTEHECPKCGYRWSGQSAPTEP